MERKNKYPFSIGIMLHACNQKLGLFNLTCQSRVQIIQELMAGFSLTVYVILAANHSHETRVARLKPAHPLDALLLELTDVGWHPRSQWVSCRCWSPQRAITPGPDPFTTATNTKNIRNLHSHGSVFIQFSSFTNLISAQHSRKLDQGFLDKAGQIMYSGDDGFILRGAVSLLTAANNFS